jgi:transcriptional regulator with XRE-family HTH domain
MSAPAFEPDLRLRRIRESSGVSMAHLARMVGCHYAHFAQIERGARRPSPALAHRIAHALSDVLERDVRVEEFFEPRPRPRRAA